MTIRSVDEMDGGQMEVNDADDREFRLERIYRKRLTSLVVRTAVFIGALSYLFTGVFGFAYIESNDMYPALRDGDMVMYYRKADLMNTDVVIYTGNEGRYAGRIEACRGSVIDVTAEGQITINGNIQPVQERMGIFSRTVAKAGPVYPMELKDGQYFVLGDNRADAEDSRIFGAIDEGLIRGKVILVIRRRSI